MLNVFIERYDRQVPVRRVLEISAMVTAFEVTYADDFYYPGESHPFWELVCVLEGEVNVTADERVMQLHENQIILHKPMEFHRLWSANKTRPHLMIVSFQTAFLFQAKERIFDATPQQIALLQSLIAQNRDVFCFEDICTVSVKPGKALAFQLFVNRLEQLLLMIFDGTASLAAENKSQSAKNYALIINTLHAHIGEQLTLSDIAWLTKMSESNIKRTFERYANIGVIKYFNLLKIRAAIPMLESGLTVSETALRLGFAEPCYFSTVFKRMTGDSPRAYLKKQQSYTIE